MKRLIFWTVLWLFSISPAFCQSMVSIGLMSGTSMDGIDVALIHTDGETEITEVTHASFDYPHEFHQLLKAAEYVVRIHKGDLDKALQSDFMASFQEYLTDEMRLPTEIVDASLKKASVFLHNDPSKPIHLQDVVDRSTQLHALVVEDLLKQQHLSPSQIDVIGYHGQTLYHAPAQKLTVQVGNGQYLADVLDIRVVAQFRQQDIENGGQGAPFAPLYHRALGLRDHLIPMAVINCGGIGNITIVPSIHIDDLSAYDTGPGNGLIDLWVKQRTQFRENMDFNGKYGRQGHVKEGVLAKLWEKSVTVEGQNYFHLSAPKSLDIHDMVLIPEMERLSLADGCATLEAFTARSIAQSVPSIQGLTIVLAGGGWNNPVLLNELKIALKHKPVKIILASEAGWNNKALEAQIFAYLAVRSLKGLPLSIPRTTKVRKPMSGGFIYLPTNPAK